MIHILTRVGLAGIGAGPDRAYEVRGKLLRAGHGIAESESVPAPIAAGWIRERLW